MPTSARYWRVLIQGFSGYPTIDELEFALMGQAKHANVTPISDSNAAPAADGFDGSYGNFWAPTSAATGTWLGMDFGSAVQVDVVRLKSRYGLQYLTAFDVQSSSNGSSWTTEWSVTGIGYLDWLQPFPRPGQGKVLWKVNVTAVDSPETVWSGQEVEWHTTAGGSDITSPGDKVFGDRTANPPANAIDNNSATVWATSGLPSAYVFEFATAPAMAELAMTSWAIHPNACGKNFTIESSEDGMAWTTEYTVTGATWTGGDTQNFTFGGPSSAGNTFRISGFIG